MGYYATCNDSDFRMKAENIPAAVEAIVNSELFVSKYSLFPYEYAEKPEVREECLKCARSGDVEAATQLLESLCDHYGYSLSTGPDGSITGIVRDGEKYHDDQDFFETFASFVEKGCFLEYCGEDGELWRTVFDGEHCFEASPVVSWPEHEALLKEIAEEAALDDQIRAAESVRNDAVSGAAERSVEEEGPER